MNEFKDIKKKTNSRDISKELLVDLYFSKNMTLDEIGIHFGYIDRQPIMRLFKKYELKTRSVRDTAKIKKEMKIPPREVVERMIECGSALAASKKYNISRKMVTSYLEHYNLKPNYFVNKDITPSILDIKFNNSSPKEISMALGVDISTVKKYKKDFISRSYSAPEIREKFEKYNYNTKNKGFIRQLQYDDDNLYNSILELTKDHALYGDKITEKIYRLFNNYSPGDVEKCKYCSNSLKFYTFELGYGNSEHKICDSCNNSINGVSLASKDLFNAVYEKLKPTLTENDVCHYDSLNNEIEVCVTEDDFRSLPEHTYYLNRTYYRLDFLFNRKVIEFDGAYYHTEPKKELAKDAFLNLKGYEVMHIIDKDYYKNKDETIQRCLNFLNQ
jgi:hypothetical protein